MGPPKDMKKTLFLAFILVVSTGTIFAEEAKLMVALQEQWSNVFGGKESVFHLSVRAQEELNGRVGWQFSSSGRTLARGEREVSVQPGEIETVEVRLQVPEVKEGVVMQASLSVSVYKGGADDAVTNLEKQIWIFPEDPFSHQKQWLKELKIHLFDPEKKTAEVFSDAEIPFDRVSNIDSFAEIKEGVLIIGEGVSLRDYRGLSKMMLKAAAAGTPVLCLTLAGGEMTFPGMGDVDLPQPKSMSFRRNDIITELDKRLDADAWPPDGKVVVGSVKLNGEKGPVVGEIEKQDGWPWVEIDFGNKEGRLVICGFGIIEKWNSGPTPRFLLARILEYLEEDKVKP